jgi:undecaprenyl-diphosphatase
MTRTSSGSAKEDRATRTAGGALLALVARFRRAGWSRIRALHAALGLTLTIGLVVAALLLWGFIELTDEVLEGDTLAFDRSILAWLHAHRTTFLDRAARELTALGSLVVLAVTALGFSVVLWRLERRRHVAMIWFAMTGSAVLNQGLKAAFGRARPSLFESLVPASSFSFPSGHSMNAMVYYTVVGFAIGHVVGPGAARTGTYLVSAILVVLVGWSRMHLGVHYPSDVIAGFAVGTSWALLCAAATEAWGKRLRAEDRGSAA